MYTAVVHNTCETLGKKSLKHVAQWYLACQGCLRKINVKSTCVRKQNKCIQGGKTKFIIIKKIVKSSFSIKMKINIFCKFLPRNSEGPFLIQMAYFGKFGSIEMSVASWSSPRLSALELTLSSTVGWGVFSLLQSSSFGEYSSLSSSSSFS